jgi:hypothetical protein
MSLCEHGPASAVFGVQRASLVPDASALLCRETNNQHHRHSHWRVVLQACVQYLPTSRSYAAGFRSSSELSSRSGVRHFWQYMVGEAHPRSAENWLVVCGVVLCSWPDFYKFASMDAVRCFLCRAGACSAEVNVTPALTHSGPANGPGPAAESDPQPCSSPHKFQVVCALQVTILVRRKIKYDLFLVHLTFSPSPFSYFLYFSFLTFVFPLILCSIFSFSYLN